MPASADLRSTPTPGEAETRPKRGFAATSVPVLPDARITTAGPIAPDGSATNQRIVAAQARGYRVEGRVSGVRSLEALAGIPLRRRVA
jgi:hypothetical protein